MRVLSIALTLTALMASSASAAIMSLQRNGMTAGTDSRKVTILTVPYGPGSDTSAKIPGTIRAGGFDMTDLGGVSGNFVAWCLDPEHWLHTLAEYTPTDTPFSNSFMDDAGRARVQNVFDANFDSVDPTQGIASASFQLALWEAVYDTGYDLTSGVFTAEGDGPGEASISATAASYLDNARNYSGGQRHNLTFLQSLPYTSGDFTHSQNLVTATVSAVPLPAASMALLTGLGGLVLVRRRRKTEA